MADRELIIRRCDQVMFYAVCGLAWFIPISIALVEWMFGIGLLAWLVKRGTIFKALLAEEGAAGWAEQARLLAMSFKPKHTVLNLPLLVFLGVVIVSAVFGFHPLTSLSAVLTKVLQWGMTCVIVVEAVATRKQVRIIALVLLASAALISVNGLIQYTTGTGLIRQRTVVDGRRVMSTFRHPNDFAGWLTIILPTVFALSFMQFLRVRQGRDIFLQGSDRSGFLQSTTFIAIVFGVLLLTGICLGLTYSRGGWLATGLALLAATARQPRMLMPLLVAGALFLGIFALKMVSDRTTNIGGSMKNVFTNVSDRDTIWGEGLDLVRERPLLGIGFNNYLATVKERGNKRQEYAHNCYLQMAAETGLAGLLAFLWIPFSVFREGRRQLSRIRDSFPHHFLLGLLTGLGAFLLHSFFDTNFYSTQLSSLLWLTVGLIMAIPRTEGQGPPPA